MKNKNPARKTKGSTHQKNHPILTLPTLLPGGDLHSDKLHLSLWETVWEAINLGTKPCVFNGPIWEESIENCFEYLHIIIRDLEERLK